MKKTNEMMYNYWSKRLEAFWHKYKFEIKLIGGALLVVCVISHFAYQQDERPQTFKDRVEQHLSKWDGSHRKLETYIKASMNDPGSYQHISTSYIMPPDTATAAVFITTFRGKNAFGGVVTQTVRARCNIQTGKVEAILSE